MKSKKSKWFLGLSLTFFAASVVYIILELAVNLSKLEAAFPNDPARVSIESVYIVFVYVLFSIPTLFLELSCIRSTYKLLKHSPTGFTKICYIISAALAFAAFVLQFFGVIDFVGDSYSRKLAEDVLLITGWPIFIISFILGSKNLNANNETAES